MKSERSSLEFCDAGAVAEATVSIPLPTESETPEGLTAFNGGPEANEPRVVIIADNASYNFGGEAVLPLHYFRRMRARGMAAWMIVNERNRSALAERLLPAEMDHIHFVPDGKFHRRLGRIAVKLPSSIASFTIGQLIGLVDQRRSVKVARSLMKKHRFTIVHQPVPVSPKHVSLLWNRGTGGLGVPVVMGPMNGGINYPKTFSNREHPIDRVFVTTGRLMARWIHRLLPGKLRAETLMVANERTRDALPRGAKGRVEHVVENGVDLSLYWSAPREAKRRDESTPVRFAFAGRLVDFKGVDLLLEATALAKQQIHLHVDILGDGPMRTSWEKNANRLGVDAMVTFHGWKSHHDCAEQMAASDVFVLPSLRECGGAVVLEAMAMRLPVIAANWGGPADYLDESCGVLVDVGSRQSLVRDLADAMVRLGRSPELRITLGQAGYEKVLREYDWERKVDRIISIYKDAMTRAARNR